MKNILLTIIITFVVIVIVGLIYIYSGSYNVGQMQPHGKLTQWIVDKTREHSIEKRVKEINVPKLDSTMYAEGARHYNEMCVVCHGAPGHSPSEMVEGLNPKPPRLLRPEDVAPPAAAFWVIKYGIKMTSMPAFGPTHSDDEIWAITAFTVNKMVKMSGSEYNEMVKE